MAERSDNFSLFKSQQDTSAVSSIYDFLGRPILWFKGNLNTTDAITTFKFAAQWSLFPIAPIWYDKIKGHYGFRGDLKLRLQVNANRYMQGIYMLYYVPTAGAQTNTGSRAEQKVNAHMFSLIQRTQLPNVQINVSCETEVELIIPYQSMLPFVPIHASAPTFNLGNIYIVPYSPLVSPTGSSSAGFSLFASWVNVKLQGASTPQMASIPEEEQKKLQIGPVSTALSNISKAATIVSHIPLLSSFASTAAWASNLGARVASAFGYSKPIIVSPHTRVLRNTFQGWNNSDVADASQPLSLLASNTVPVQSGAMGNDIDEMSVSYIAQKWSYIDQFEWNEVATDPAGTVKYTAFIHPGNFSDTYSDNTLSVTCFTPLAFCSEMFNMWRGGIKFRFKIAKTEFHSGRLAVSYLPFDDDYVPVPGNTTLENTYYLERDILDIRYGREFTLTVPYMNHMPYRSTFDRPSTGRLQIHVLDPLTRPSSVSSSITVLVEVCGAEDIEFAVPRPSPLVPYIPSTIQMASLEQECEIVDKTIGSMRLGPNITKFAELCVGEKIVSFRQLLKSTNYLPIAYTRVDTNCSAIMPQVWEPYDNSIVGTHSPPPSSWPDMYSFMSSIFAAFSGSIRIKIMSSEATKNKWLTRLIQTTIQPTLVQPVLTPTTIFPNIANMGLAVVSDPLVSGGIELLTPFYSRTNIHSTFDTLYSANGLPNASNRTEFVYTATQYLEDLSPAYARSGGDDINFYGFISIPPFYDYQGLSSEPTSFQ
jgi:hypothetical protein